MKKFLVLCTIPPSVMDEWMKTPAESRKTEEEKVTRELQAWYGRHAKLFTDVGAGLGKTRRVTKDGNADARNGLVMYAIAQGESKEAVAKVLQDHPHLQIPQASMDVMELFPLPGQT